ncbi:MAG: MaoC family dehydratase [Candidatus Marinimicrobia bacterium]|nr:MaoC family dehydratase [Candidatus Neomarinimicrobiota bacterium]
MNVYEFIREKTEGFQENAAEFRAKLEPRFRNWSHTINDKITNTLNNPWITNLNPFDKKVTSTPEAVITNKVTERVYKELKEKLGQEIFAGEWETIDQDCINQFAEITGDTQWIHTDPERAKKESPFKSTIVHGFLTLSLIPKLTNTISSGRNLFPEARMVVNYGLNQVRFPYPVKSGSRVRARTRIIGVQPKNNSIELINEISIEVENRKRYACVAETVFRLYF